MKSLIFSLFNCIVPKDESSVVIHSTPDFCDMTRAIVNSSLIVERTINILVSKNTLIPEWAINKNINIFKKNSIFGIFFYMRSKYCFFTHGLFSSIEPNKNQIVVNLWHGMPLKLIGYDDVKNNGYIPYSSYTVATSKFYQNIISKAFGIKKENVLLTGLPRNDILMEKSRNPKIQEYSKKYSSIIVWLPTYRRSVLGDIRQDGIEQDSLYGLPLFDEESFITYLNEKNILCFIKPHPMHKKVANKITKHLKIIDEKWLLSNNISLYELLSVTDILITDISSVYIDFLLRDKPIIFSFPDKHEYIKSRGTYFSNINNYLAGDIVVNKNELTNAINKIYDGSDSFEEFRRDMFKKFHAINNNELLYSENLFLNLK